MEKTSFEIQGYGVKTKKLDLAITRKTVNFLKPPRRPIQVGSSAPVIEFLAGRMDWEAVESCVRKQKSAFPKFNDECAMGLMIPDLHDPDLGAVAFPLHEKGDVTPAVILRASGNVWIAEACVFETEFLTSSMIAKFNSASVAALVELARGAFRKVLIAPHMAASRLTYARDTNDGFLPDVPEGRKWTIASHWPDWRRRRLGLPACNVELNSLEKTNAFGDEAFRQIVSRLKLQISDKTDEGGCHKKVSEMHPTNSRNHLKKTTLGVDAGSPMHA